MAVIASLHFADVGVGGTVRLARKKALPSGLDGLRHATLALATPLRASAVPVPSIGRAGLFAIWDDDAALDQFLAGHPLAERLADGWTARLEPLRATGSWPGLPDDLPTDRASTHDGPAVVVTLGRLRIRRAVRFLRASAGAVASLPSSGLVWGTAFVRPPFVSTCSLWESSEALSKYAYGRRDPGHPNAIAADAKSPFHHMSAFVRFRPYAVTGSLGGKNPLPEGAAASGA